MRSLFVLSARGEMTVWNCLPVTRFNDRFGDIGCIAAKDLLQVRGDAA